MSASTDGTLVRRRAVLDQAALEAWGRAVGEAAVGEAAAGAGGGAGPSGEAGPAGGARPGLPLVLGLRGPLGAGKSVLARAVARGAGVAAPMPSPTYNLLFTYPGRAGVTVHHLDLYRLDDPEDVWELGWRELGEGDEVVLIEWPGRAESLLPPDRWDVGLEFLDAATPGAALLRRVTVTRRGRAPELPPLPSDATQSGAGDRAASPSGSTSGSKSRADVR